MDVLLTPSDVQLLVREHRRAGKSIGVVPTMGALHDGHLSLVRAARKNCDIVVTTIFVNPEQFGPGEDFDEYPRDLDTDLKLCDQEGSDIVFAPSANTMYGDGSSTTVRVGGLTEVLEGIARPTHFEGVTTVVAILFNITLPDQAYFGQKDYQQQLAIRRMILDLNWPIEVVTCPIVRESDGLAMSSRNHFLNAEERHRALGLSRALKIARHLAKETAAMPDEIQVSMEWELSSSGGIDLDYAVVVDQETLQPLSRRPESAVALIAACVGQTRLIDNCFLTFAGSA